MISLERRKNLEQKLGEAGYVIKYRKPDELILHPCPLHKDKTPSLTVNMAKGFYRCFSCIPSDEEILTSRGLIKIGDITVDDRIWDGQRFNDISAVSRKKKNDFIKIETMYNKIPLKCTPEHKIFIYENGSVIEKMACDIKIGDNLVYPKNHIENEISSIDTSYTKSKYLTKNSYNGKLITLPEKIEINEDLLKIIGIYIAEGSSDKRNSVITLNFSELQIAKEISDAIFKVFGIKSTIYEYPERNTCKIITSNKLYARLMDDICGKNSENKHIPFDLMNIKLEKLEYLMKWIIVGDGYENEKIVQIGQTSKTLALQLWDISIKLGHFSRIYHRKEKNKKDVFIISWTNNKYSKENKGVRDKFGRFIKGITGIRNGDFNEDYHLLKVNSIERYLEVNPIEVTDIEVECSHRFSLNGRIVHNCDDSGSISKLLRYYGIKYGFYYEAPTIDELEELLNEPDTSAEIPPETTYKSNESELKRFRFYHPYLESRGFNKEFILANKIGFNTTTLRVMIPIYFKGRYWGCIQRSVCNDTPKVKYDDSLPKEQILYCPLTNTGKSKYLFVVEGFADALRVSSFGEDACAILGCHVSEVQLRYIYELANGREIMWAFDNDAAGKKGLEKCLELINGLDGHKIFCYTDGTKDPGEITTKEQLMYGIENAKEIWEY